MNDAILTITVSCPTWVALAAIAAWTTAAVALCVAVTNLPWRAR